MNTLKVFLFGNKVPLPDAVKKSMNKFQKEGEIIDHFFCKIQMGGMGYYEIVYNNVRDSSKIAKLIIREDGSIPPIEEVCQDNFQDVVWIANSTDNACVAISKSGKKWSKYPTYPYKRVMKLLSCIQNAFWNQMTQDIREAWKSYCKVAEVYIDKQKVIQECYEKGIKIDEKLFQTHVVSLEDCKELERYHMKMAHSAYYQNHVQLNTYEDRKKLLSYLFSCNKWFKWGLWLAILELLYHHSRLLNEKKLTEADLKDIEINHEKYMKEDIRLFKDDIDFYEETRLALRNPNEIGENK
ncbi:hypothetical protein [Mechercharimyces sp. CAU 1602]|uniref:hypothetical protein n=1 Tax=Mechercharimyces sp. CAU 1602 TaxID=2973933 RepID=UPI0021615BFC|nr:hypothetical protein [Mechercharimyces sp. CAU 1602]MCS1350883.1 hypothetical protein [Mechercharimyces sp. CAU 1602]